MIHWIEGIASVVALGLAALLAVSPRFGKGTRQLLYLLLPASLSAAVQALGPDILSRSTQDCFRISFAFIILASSGGLIAIGSLNGRAKKKYFIPVCLLALLFSGLLLFVNPSEEEGLQAPEGYFSLGIPGYLSGLFLLITAVLVLALIEQMLRNASETARWELKFLFLGVGALYASIIYMSSQVLLFSPRSGFILTSAVGLFHTMLLISVGLITLSWKRSSGKARFAVSHGAIYSSITLLSIGIYLIASSLIARLASRWGGVDLPTEALIFLLSALALTTLFLGTGFRHQTRAWIRRNIFAGRYDYRRFWLEATEHVRSIDPLPTAAAALADIVHRALGAIEVSVWVRLWDPNRLALLSAMGSLSDSLGKEESGIIEEILDISEPIAAGDLEDAKGRAQTREFIARTHASLLVPLLSSNRIVGVIAVGTDRSGHPYDYEAKEFLRALAGHAAGEFHKSDLLATLVEAKEDEAFRNFSTFVLHDLKNFASTLSYIAQNAPRHQNNPEFQKDAFQSVYETAEKMKRLCNSLKTFSSTLAADKKPADLNQVVRSVADSLNGVLSRYLKLELEDLPPAAIDAEEIKRVLQNLILNAREAISEDGYIIIRSAARTDHIEVSVEDNGKGMSRQFLEKELFLPFHTTKSSGLGIGLFQSKKIMEAHQGTIAVDSEEGKGTKVSLIFRTL